MPCARCDAENPAGARFCSACGARLQAACPNCGAALQDGQRFCNGCGLELAAAAPTAVDPGERRHATVMFSDLTGYTALNEATDPEEVEAIMGRIKDEATAVIERHGGTVNQFVGDEIMALFGVPLARRDDPRRAVAAALELHAAVGRLITDLGPAPGRPRPQHAHRNQHRPGRRPPQRRARRHLRTDRRRREHRRPPAQPGRAGRGARQRRHLAAGGRPFRGGSAARRSRSRARSGRSRRIASAASGRHRRRAPARSSAGTRSSRDFAAVAAACAERQRSRVVVVRGDPGVGKSRLVAEFATQRARRSASPATPPPCSTSARKPAATRSAAWRAACSASPARSSADERRAAIERAAAARPIAPDRQSVPLRPARRDAAARASRPRRGDEHGGPRAGLAARHVRAGDDGRQRPRRCS